MAKTVGSTELDYGVDIQKVKFLEGSVREEAKRLKLDDNDTVIIRRSFHSFPRYHLEKVEGDVFEALKKISKTDNIPKEFKD